MSQSKKKRSLMRAPIHMFGGFFALLHQLVQFEKSTLNWTFGIFLVLYMGIVEFFRLYLGRNESRLVERWPRLMNWYNTRWMPWWIKHGGMRESELRELTASAYYWAGLTFVYVLLPLHCVVPAMLILAFGDPFARMVGMRWGKSSFLLQGKSVAGCIAFATVSMLAIAVSFAVDLHFNGLMLYTMLTPMSLILAVLAAMVVEVYGGKYDNFFIPVAAGFLLAAMNG